LSEERNAEHLTILRAELQQQAAQLKASSVAIDQERAELRAQNTQLAQQCDILHAELHDVKQQRNTHSTSCAALRVELAGSKRALGEEKKRVQVLAAENAQLQVDRYM
jgi:regulator of replication initiation timing